MAELAFLTLAGLLVSAHQIALYGGIAHNFAIPSKVSGSQSFPVAIALSDQLGKVVRPGSIKMTKVRNNKPHLFIALGISSCFANFSRNSTIPVCQNLSRQHNRF